MPTQGVKLKFFRFRKQPCVTLESLFNVLDAVTVSPQKEYAKALKEGISQAYIEAR